VTGLVCSFPNADGYTCEHSVGADGVEVRVETNGPYTTADCGMPKCAIKHLRVRIHRPDGIYVQIESTSGPFGSNRAATRAEPLLGLDQSLAMARDPRWGLTMDAAFVDQAAQTVHLDNKQVPGNGPTPTPGQS
jgi:hypothetical protein